MTDSESSLSDGLSNLPTELASPGYPHTAYRSAHHTGLLRCTTTNLFEESHLKLGQAGLIRVEKPPTKPGGQIKLCWSTYTAILDSFNHGTVALPIKTVESISTAERRALETWPNRLEAIEDQGMKRNPNSKLNKKIIATAQTVSRHASESVGRAIWSVGDKINSMRNVTPALSVGSVTGNEIAADLSRLIYGISGWPKYGTESEARFAIYSDLSKLKQTKEVDHCYSLGTISQIVGDRLNNSKSGEQVILSWYVKTHKDKRGATVDAGGMPIYVDIIPETDDFPNLTAVRVSMTGLRDQQGDQSLYSSAVPPEDTPDTAPE